MQVTLNKLNFGPFDDCGKNRPLTDSPAGHCSLLPTFHLLPVNDHHHTNKCKWGSNQSGAIASTVTVEFTVDSTYQSANNTSPDAVFTAVSFRPASDLRFRLRSSKGSSCYEQQLR